METKSLARARGLGRARNLGLGGACLVAALAGGPPETVFAAPTLAGATGLVKIPTGDTAGSGDLLVGFSWVGGPQSYLFAPKPNRMYFATLGILPGLEVTLDMLQVVGWSDPEAPGVANAIHRLSSAKWTLPLPGSWPRIAVGVQDPISVNALVRGPIGATAYELTTYYGVISQHWGGLALHAGYGRGKNFLDGPFGGIDWEAVRGLDLRFEHDSRQFNLGAYWRPFEFFALGVARLFPDDWAYLAELTWQL